MLDTLNSIISYVSSLLYNSFHELNQILEVPLLGPLTLKTVILTTLLYLFVHETLQHSVRRIIDSRKGAKALSSLLSLTICFEYIAITTPLSQSIINIGSYLTSIIFLSSLLFSFLDEIALFKESINWGIALALSLIFVITNDTVKFLIIIMNSLPFLLALISFSILFLLKKERWGYIISAFIIGSLLLPPSYFLISLIVFSLLVMTLLIIPLHHKMYSLRLMAKFQKNKGIGEGKGKFKIILKEIKYLALSLLYSTILLTSYAYIQTGNKFKALLYGGSCGVIIILLSLIWEFLLIHNIKKNSIDAINREIEEYKKYIKELEKQKEEEENIDIKAKYNKWIENINTQIKELEERKVKIMRGEE